MTQIVLGLQYDGSALHGWQRQLDQTTVQGLLEDAVGRVADHPVTLAVAGRTDAGVHATGQVAAFVSDAERTADNWRRGINALTPASITVSWVREANDEFHPRYSAIARRYLYVCFDGPENPFTGRFVWRLVDRLDADAMHREAQALVGEHDFTSFRAAGCQSVTPMRRVNRCDVRRVGPFVVVDIEANAFLLHMVRNVARGLVDVGFRTNDLPVREILAARDRDLLGPTAPPHGLYLYRVSYRDSDSPESGPPALAFPDPILPPILAASAHLW
jgi:tRNA pseudouridine38-40 synthase